MKKLIKLFALLIILVIGAVIAVYFYLDRIAQAAIERGGTYAMGVDTRVDSAALKPFQGELAMKGLEVSNPQDFATDHFLKLKQGDVAVALASLRQDVIEVPRVALAGADVNLEKKAGKSNYKIILENLKRLESTAPGEGKRYVVRELTVSNIIVHIDLLGAGGISKINVPIDEIKLRNVGSDTSRGMLISELWGVLVKAILAAVVDKAGGIIPDDVLGELKGGLGELESLARIADIEKLGELIKPAESLGEGTVEVINKAVGELGGILGGKKEPKP